MAKFLLIPAGLALAVVWTAWLERRYGQQVSPDATIPAGLALLAGWLLIALAAVVVIVL